jgi:hypothetical protein
MPGQNGAGLYDGGHFRQRLLAELLGDRCQRPALDVGQLYTACEPVPEDASFGHQRLIPQQQFLIDDPRDVCEQYFPAHTPLHLRFFRSQEGGVSARAWAEFKPKRR